MAFSGTVILLLLGAMLLHLPAWAGDRLQHAMGNVRVGFAVTLFGEVDLQDAKVAIETWCDELGKLMNLQPHAMIFANLAEVKTLVKNRAVDLVVLDALDYLHLQGQKYLEPVLTGMVNGQVGYDFILVAHHNTGISQLSQLRGKVLNLQGIRGTDAIPRLWLDALLREQGLASSTAFFSKIKTVKKSSQAVLPVFFSKVDAAVITREDYNTLVELNPQIGQSLAIIASSPRYLQSLLTVRKNLPDDVKEQIIAASLKLSGYPRGCQILNLFRTGGVTPLKPAYLKSLQGLTTKSR
jgi:ABC-type phosphate/phosphonate transport system substrate-binding protein